LGQLHLASFGGKADQPFQGLNQSRPLWGRIFTVDDKTLL